MSVDVGGWHLNSGLAWKWEISEAGEEDGDDYFPLSRWDSSVTQTLFNSRNFDPVVLHWVVESAKTTP